MLLPLVCQPPSSHPTTHHRGLQKRSHSVGHLNHTDALLHPTAAPSTQDTNACMADKRRVPFSNINLLFITHTHTHTGDGAHR